jgi:CheY-like chemotaxis protein
VRIEVIDTGIGIAADQIDQIFEEFHQIGNPERDRTQGLGLGLAIARRLGRLLGHDVSVRSLPGRGSCFSITLPIAEHPAVTTAREPTVAPTSDAARGLVVVIDDEAIVLMGLQAMVKEWGYEVIAATSLEQALARLNHHRDSDAPSLIITDYRLRHGRTGLEAIQAIRDRCGTTIPSIILTGDTTLEPSQQTATADYSILHKPIAPTMLRASITERLSRDRLH